MARAKFLSAVVAAAFLSPALRARAADVGAPPPVLQQTAAPVASGVASGVARAADPAASSPSADPRDVLPPPDRLTLTPEYASDAPVPIRRAPLMDVLNYLGYAQPLEKAGINVYGEVEGSFNYNFSDPHVYEPARESHQIELRMYDHHSNQAILQRMDLYVDRVVNYHHTTQFDLGGLVELQYGHDAAMMHSNGLMDYRKNPASPTGYGTEHNPYYQWDLTEAFLDFALPVGNGLRVRAGKFATIMGYESCDPVHNQAIQFYSRTYLLTFGIPMYQTGGYATYDISDNVTANAGFSRGWEQAFKDNNSAIDFLGSINFILNDNFTDYVALSEGPEEPSDDSHYRTDLENIVYFTPNPRGPWNFALDALLGFEDDRVTEYFNFVSPEAEATAFSNKPPGNVSWKAVALFGGYRINNRLQVKARVEWFDDDGGTRFRYPYADRNYTATVMSDSAVQIGKNYNAYEATFGLDWYPFTRYLATLKIRPELRFDYTDKAILVVDRNGHNTHDQLTFGIDALYRF
jgi:hypothetical protein